MRSFRSRIELSPKLPDDRLYWLHVDPEAAVVQSRYRQGFIGPEFVQDAGELTRHLLVGGIFILDDEGKICYTGGTQRWADDRPPETGAFEIAMERAPEEMLRGRSIRVRLSPTSLLFVVEEHLVQPELAREYNEVSRTAGFGYRVWQRPEVNLMDLW